MKFGQIFARPIDRHMDSVIKSDDKSYLADELEEYVLTPEVRRFLQRFCDEYNNKTSDGNGAWISGFYGSGKSHLLKILSYLLENAEVGGRRALDYLKPSLADDPMLLSALERACERTPSESILFNIGGKSDAQRRDTGESLLNAFIKVLNEKCGYFSGEQAHVAALERDLDRAGLYEAFKAEVETTMKRPWEQVRKNPTIFAGKVSAIFDRVSGQPEGTTKNIFDYYLRSYHPTPEDFANWCAEYIQRREKGLPGFRLNFFVDEMGQYIADSVPLLQMLQDITEKLHTRCGRRAWIVVVSQEEMRDVTGKLDTNQAGSFSKIQARFKVLMKIPANDASTVVKQRLLEKDPAAVPSLDALYDTYSGDFKVLLDFPDGAKHYHAYEDREDFCVTYPLVGYQFPMFHDALTGLSDHDAFTGEYVSTGARNMLGTSHKVLVSRRELGDVARGDLIPFDAMFEGLRDELKSEVFNAITQAEDHFADPLGVRILKALLLVKYNRGFVATPKNLSVLLYDSFSTSQPELEERIAEVCRQLDAQTYVRRNGDAYEYLTDDEKDVEEEIKREPVMEAEVSKETGKLLQEILGQTKVRHVNAGFSTTFAYDLLVDGQAVGSQRNELKVSVLTDATPSADETFKFAQPKQLLIALPRNTRLTQEVRLWRQTMSYVSVNHGAEGRRSLIIEDKKQANEQRRREIIDMLRSQLDTALFGTCLQDVTDKATGQGADRVASAVQLMVASSYPHLRMLALSFTKGTVYAAATGTRLMPGESLPEYCEEVLTEVKRLHASSARCLVGGPTDNSLEARLGRGDHGWPVEAVRQAVAVLAVNDLVECARGDVPLEGADLASALSNGTHLDGVVVRPALGYSQEQLDALRNAYQRLSGMAPSRTDAKGIADDLRELLGEKCAQAKHDLAQMRGLPFEGRYQGRVRELEGYATKNRSWFIGEVASHVDAMESALKDVDGMRGFANGPMGRKYAEARDFLSAQTLNIESLPGLAAPAAELRVLLQDESCYTYSFGPKANGPLRTMRAAIDEALAQARKEAHANLTSFAMQFRTGEYLKAPETAKRQADEIIAACDASIDTANQIQVVRGIVQQFKAHEAERLYALVTPPPEPPKGGGPDAHSDATTKSQPTRPVVVSFDQISVPQGFRNRTLSTPEQVEAFVDALRKDMLIHVFNNEKIIL